MHSIFMLSGFSTQFYDGAKATRAPIANSKKKAYQFGFEGNSGATEKKGFAISWIERIYLIGLVVVEI